MVHGDVSWLCFASPKSHDQAVVVAPVESSLKATLSGGNPGLGVVLMST